MFSPSDNSKSKRYPYLILIFLIVVSALLPMGMLHAPTHQQSFSSIFELGYLVGPVTQSLLNHQGLQVCTQNMGTPDNSICFKSARMPVVSFVLATGVRLFGDHPVTIATAKTLLFMIPIWVTMGLVLGVVQRSGGNLFLCATFLILPFLIVNYLIVITGLEAEEGYMFGLFPLVLALIACVPRPGIVWALGVAVTLDLVYLAKSSMLLAVLVLLVACIMKLPSWNQRLVVLVLVGLAPASWAIRQHHVSGRYSLGTSLDGLNLHKGNNDQFQNRYPISNRYLDHCDPELNKYQYFTSEWAFNDYHLAQARKFMLTHPLYTAQSDGRKAFVLLLSLKGYTATVMGRGEELLTDFGLISFRLLLWGSLVLAIMGAFHQASATRFLACTYLAFVAAYSAPYIIGFGFTRHAILLVYPAAVFCALSLRPDAPHASELLTTD